MLPLPVPDMARMGRCAKLAWEHAVLRQAQAPGRTAGVNTAHLLHGVLMEPDCAGGLILRRMGVNLALVDEHASFMNLHARPTPVTPERGTVDWQGVAHTPLAERVLALALEEAGLYSDTYPIGTEHLLLGILRLPDSTGAKVLGYMGVTEQAARTTRDAMWELLRLTE
ncbi:MAG: Clp protease N-terminal domain-containing protein [Chloroflexota bacterium]